MWIHKRTHTNPAEACCMFTKLASVLHVIVVSDAKMFFFSPNKTMSSLLHAFFFPIPGHGLLSPGAANFGNTWTVASKS